MCSAKGSQFSIEPNGEVYSCKGANGYLGNIKNGINSLLESLEYKKHINLEFTNPKECKDCFIEIFCSGLCLDSLESKFKTIDTVEENACGVYKGITKKYE